MSELKQYIDDNLKRYYTKIGVLSETAVNSLTVYENNLHHKKIVVIRTMNRNDAVFRTLKAKDTQGRLPMIYEVATEEDALYVIEEFIEGETLYDTFGKENLSDNEIKRLFLSICDCLEVLHSLHIIHRDIKPNNIMVKPDGTVCIVDLSIAKTMSENEARDTVNLGTIGYAAPEQFGFSQSSPATDIYALGVMMNQLLLGVHPTSAVPKGKLGKIIKKCTSTQISNRYQTTAELKNALRHI